MIRFVPCPQSAMKSLRLRVSKHLLRVYRFPYRNPMSAKAYRSHEERTANEPREDGLHRATVDDIQNVHSRVKLFRLVLQDREQGLQFRAGQWLDVFVPGLSKAGGFTITSTPPEAAPSAGRARPYVELAIQDSPSNLPAAWLWKPMTQVLGQELLVRVGGSFTLPPAGLDMRSIDRIVFIAGGVGINPLISMLSDFFHHEKTSKEWSHITVDVLYSTKLAPAKSLDKVLFLHRMSALAARYPKRLKLQIWLTDLEEISFRSKDRNLQLHIGRMTSTDIVRIMECSQQQRQKPLCYVCGPQQMTDELVDLLRGLDGVESKQVLCEKWW